MFSNCHLLMTLMVGLHNFFLEMLRTTKFLCTIGGHKNLGQTSQLYKVKNQKYTLGKFGFLQTRL
jgi:hypothetical protein